MHHIERDFMKTRRFLRARAALAAALVLASAMQMAPTMSVSAANIIKNSTFDTNAANWGTYKESGGACSLGISDGQLALTVKSVGEVNYAVQVFYDIIPLYQNGVYHISYDISSSLDRYIEAMIQQNGGTYQAYTWKGLNLTSEPQTVSYDFTMEYETDIMSKLVFNCGTQGEDLPEHTIYIDNVTLELIDDSAVDYTATQGYQAPILTNQLGYRPDSAKSAVFRGITSETEFSVVNADTKETVYTGTLSEPVENTSAGETDWVGTFTEVTEPGEYYITCGSLDNSYPFTISDTVYDNLLDESVRMLYLQRCGCEVIDDAFGHVACHDSLATVYGTDEKIDVTGGWHDAGDYGRYIVPAAKTVADLLFAYQANPDMFSDNIGIPESGNGIADILDETRYELDWMLKMQAADGGVYHKVSCATFPGYVMPETETKPLIVTPVSTTATADFCAAMAMAYEFYYDTDKDFAEKCLAAAEKAWAFLEANPSLIFKNPSDITTGEYGDKSDKDERYWAAAQMYRATGDQKYADAFAAMSVQTGLDWTTMGDYGNIAILTMNDVDQDSDIYRRSFNAVLNQADKLLKVTNKSPYNVSLSNYYWGCNMGVGMNGVLLALAAQLSSDNADAYYDAATAQIDYLLGHNPLGTSFVTGYGTVAPENPHHRPSMVVGKAMNAMVVGGVNPNLEDSAAKAYCADAPEAKCYVDNAESYSTNEITIYWNSPLTYLLAMTEPREQSGTDAEYGDVNVDGFVDISDVILLSRYTAEDTTISITTEGLVNADLNGDGKYSAEDVTRIIRIIAKLDK